MTGPFIVVTSLQSGQPFDVNVASIAYFAAEPLMGVEGTRIVFVGRPDHYLDVRETSGEVRELVREATRQLLQAMSRPQ